MIQNNHDFQGGWNHQPGNLSISIGTHLPLGNCCCCPFFVFSIFSFFSKLGVPTTSTIVFFGGVTGVVVFLRFVHCFFSRKWRRQPGVRQGLRKLLFLEFVAHKDDAVKETILNCTRLPKQLLPQRCRLRWWMQDGRGLTTRNHRFPLASRQRLWFRAGLFRFGYLN